MRFSSAWSFIEVLRRSNPPRFTAASNEYLGSPTPIATLRLAAGRGIAVFGIREHPGPRRLLLVDQLRLGVRTRCRDVWRRLRLMVFIVGHAAQRRRSE